MCIVHPPLGLKRPPDPSPNNFAPPISNSWLRPWCWTIEPSDHQYAPVLSAICSHIVHLNFSRTTWQISTYNDLTRNKRGQFWLTAQSLVELQRKANDVNIEGIRWLYLFSRGDYCEIKDWNITLTTFQTRERTTHPKTKLDTNHCYLKKIQIFPKKVHIFLREENTEIESKIQPSLAHTIFCKGGIVILL